MRMFLRENCRTGRNSAIFCWESVALPADFSNIFVVLIWILPLENARLAVNSAADAPEEQSQGMLHEIASQGAGERKGRQEGGRKEGRKGRMGGAGLALHWGFTLPNLHGISTIRLHTLYTCVSPSDEDITRMAPGTMCPSAGN